jgi:hypothetical protein
MAVAVRCKQSRGLITIRGATGYQERGCISTVRKLHQKVKPFFKPIQRTSLSRLSARFRLTFIPAYRSPAAICTSRGNMVIGGKRFAARKC